MNILYASDDNYAEIAAISMVSLLENNKDASDITFFILDTGISPENRKNLSDLVELYSRKIIFIEMPDIEEMAGMKLDVGCWTITAFARLFSTSLLPANVDKIIYLDCDTMTRSSISEFWNTELGDNLIAGCEDGIPVAHKPHIFLEESDIYVNSGIVLINMKAWRELNIEQKFKDFLKLFDGKLPYPDQDVINGVCKHRIKLVAPKYNCIAHYFNYNPELLELANITDYYSSQELEDATHCPVIIHFAGPIQKPWLKGSMHVYQDEYNHYRSMTAWKNAPLRHK